MDSKQGIQPSTEGQVSRTSKNIAYTLLILYASALVFTGLVAALQKDKESSQMWLDLFKSGFLILGGGLSTVVGYYFGHRGIQEAEDRLASALKELSSTREEMEKQKQKIDQLTAMQAPTYDEESLPLREPTMDTGEGG